MATRTVRVLVCDVCESEDSVKHYDNLAPKGEPKLPRDLCERCRKTLLELLDGAKPRRRQSKVSRTSTGK